MDRWQRREEADGKAVEQLALFTLGEGGGEKTLPGQANRPDFDYRGSQTA